MEMKEVGRLLTNYLTLLPGMGRLHGFYCFQRGVTRKAEGKIWLCNIAADWGCQQSCINASHLHDSVRTLMVSKCSLSPTKILLSYP